MEEMSPFSRFARATAGACGHPLTFVASLLLVVGWVVTGPVFGFSDTWQLVINTATTILTFLAVFLIQNTQNRDSRAIQLKLDELIRATQGAHIAMVSIEGTEGAQLERMGKQYQDLARQGREQVLRGEDDSGTPDVPSGP